MLEIGGWNPTDQDISRIRPHQDGTIIVGGRFICGAEEDDQMYDFLEARGLSIAETGQAEAFAARVIEPLPDAIRRLADELVAIAQAGSYRLQSIEAATPGDHNVVLLSEVNYIPWWQA